MAARGAFGKAWGNALGGYKLQTRDANGRFGPGKSKGNKKTLKRIGVVPYVRKSMRGTTGGVNAGAQVSRNRRISAGFYIRSEKIRKSELEKKFSAADRRIMDSIVGRVSPSSVLDPYVEAGVRKFQGDIVDHTIGKEHRVVGSNAHGRLTTTRGGMPSYTIRFGGKRHNKNAQQYRASRKGQRAYARATKPKPKIKKVRAQRRAKK